MTPRAVWRMIFYNTRRTRTPRDIHQPAADHCFSRFALNTGKWNACKDKKTRECQKRISWMHFFTATLFRDFFVLIYFRIKAFHVEIWHSPIFRNQKSVANLAMVTTVYRDIDFHTEKNAAVDEETLFIYYTDWNAGVRRLMTSQRKQCLMACGTVGIQSQQWNFNMHFITTSEWIFKINLFMWLHFRTDLHRIMMACVKIKYQILPFYCHFAKNGPHSCNIE